MITLTAIVSIGVFIFVFKISGVGGVGSAVLAKVQDVIATLKDNSLDDKQSEKELQRASIHLFRAFLSVLMRSALTIITSFLPIWLADLLNLATIGDVLNFLSRYDVVVIATIFIITSYIIWNRSKPSKPMVLGVNYSLMDRLLHRIAFSATSIQITAADIEKITLCKVYQDVKAEKPIFITSLPRAGTTLMLELLYHFPSLATHTYRDMPFVMAPILWSRISAPFAKRSELTERAHKDGMLISYESPEAFEEVIWRAFWPEKYTESSVALWEIDDYKEEAYTFFVDHMKKIIVTRRPHRKYDGRYISKNNANIARIGLISRMFPESKIVVPIRHPIEHAASMLNQHRNFIKIHKKERFTIRYMADIGHYEFGNLHRPIGFMGLKELISDRDALTMDYWVAYWIAAFEHVLTYKNAIIISYEDMCIEGYRVLADICRVLEIPGEGMLEKAADLFHPPSTPKGDEAGIEPKLRDRAEGVYKALLRVEFRN
jgi:hypothetical protein